MSDGEEQLRWSVEQRLEFIEFRLFWEGRLRRADLVDEFGISVPQASADIQRYSALAEGNIKYDSSAKTYVIGSSFRPHFLSPSARRYLNYLRSIADGVLRPKETWLAWLPPFDVVPLVRRRLDASKLRKVLEAIHNQESIRIEYQSMARDEPSVRSITPHGLGFDGFRWHARAWCHSREAFRDFVLARVLSISRGAPSEIDARHDTAWHQFVVHRIGPHPKLPTGARKAIELDYGMKNGVLEIRTRACLSFYLIRHLRLDLDELALDPVRQQIVLLNGAEVEELLKQTSSSSGDMT